MFRVQGQTRRLHPVAHLDSKVSRHICHHPHRRQLPLEAVRQPLTGQKSGPTAKVS